MHVRGCGWRSQDAQPELCDALVPWDHNLGDGPLDGVSDYPDVRIECDDGMAWKTKVTVNGVLLPVTRVTWTAPVDGVARCVLDVPKVALNATAQELLVRYTDEGLHGGRAGEEKPPWWARLLPPWLRPATRRHPEA